MRKFISFLLILFWTVPVFAEDLPDTVFPWGAYSNYRFSESERDEMRDTLGLNIINLAWDSRDNQDVIDFMNDGFFVYPNQGPIIDPSQTNYFKFAEAHYSIIYTNDDSSQYRFYHRNSYGSDPLYGFFPYEYVASDTLLSWYLMDKTGIDNSVWSNTIEYNRA